MDKNKVIALIRDALIPLQVDKIILFGSYAKGTSHQDSDIDLFVVTNDDFIPDSFAQKMELKLKIAQALHILRESSDIDLIVHTKPMYEKFLKLNSSFKKEILKSGTLIYETDNQGVVTSG